MFDPNRSVRLASGALFNREPTWLAYLPDAGDWTKTASLLTVPLIVVAAVLTYLLGLVSADASMFGQFRPTIASTLATIVSAAIGATVIAFVFGTLAGVFGGKRSFALGLAATTLAFVPGYAGQVLSQLPWIGGLLGIALFVYALVLLWKIIPVYLEVPAGKRTVHYITSLIATVAVMVVYSMTVGRVLNPAVPDSSFANVVQSMSSADAPMASAGSSSYKLPEHLERIKQQADLLAATSKDRYEPPMDGRMTERQMLAFLEVREKAHDIRTETGNELQALDEKTKRNRNISAADIMAASRKATDLTTLEMELVKGSDGNWAEFQWVQQAVFNARSQQDGSDAIRHNRALYEKYGDRIAEFIPR